MPFQCSRTSRVGVNKGLAGNACCPFRRFSALGRAVLGSIFVKHCKTLSTFRFQCSRTSRVGVNSRLPRTTKAFSLSFSALGRAVLGSIRLCIGDGNQARPFQCSRTSRVGVNPSPSSRSGAIVTVSVLSDEPCWGQSITAWGWRAFGTRFSALGRAVLGSMTIAGPVLGFWSCFSALGRAVLGSIFSVGGGGQSDVRFSALGRAVLGSIQLHHPR